ncbi:MAG: hypothetical protein K0V04_45130 [Deltaproteobacteria bacterium]|nr:hypothetical protein [Deltaproteobacteria bacterium]
MASPGLETLHEVPFDPAELQQQIDVPIDVAALAESETITLLFDTTDQWTPFSVETEDGQTIATSENYIEFEEGEGEDGSAHFLTRVEFDPHVGSHLIVRTDGAPDVLEGRVMLCDEMVTQRGNAGPSSLRAAIADVRDNGAVCFDPVSFADPGMGPVELHAHISTTKSLTITGTSPVPPEVTANGASRILSLSGATTIRRLVLRDGNEAYGGGLIYTNGGLKLESVILRGGVANQGGAIFSEAAPLQLIDTLVEDNQAWEDGGGIFTASPTSMVNSTLAYNAAGHSGGGLHTELYNATLSSTTVHHNTAHNGGGVTSYGAEFRLNGGSLVYSNTAFMGGGLDLDAGLATIDGASVFANVAVDVHLPYEWQSSWGVGGGILTRGPLVIVGGSTEVGMPNAVSGNTAAAGGGIAIMQSGEVWVRNDSAIEGNTAAVYGGGVLVHGSLTLEDDATVDGNHADSDGGGTHGDGTILVQDQASLANNTAGRDGGGVYNLGTVTLSGPNVLVTNNMAATTIGTGAGGGINTVCSGLLTYFVVGGYATGNSPDDVYAQPCI